MNSKKTAILAVAVLAIVISSLGAVSAFELFGMDLFGGSTTDFDNNFMSGTFAGDVTQNKVDDDNLTKGWTDSYEDKEHNITYNMSCVKDGNFITDVYQLQGLGAPEIRNYNGQAWKIFYSQAVPDNNLTDNKTSGNDTNNTINVYICEADINGTAYTINIMSYENKTECDGTLFCPLYKDYIEPLVGSIQFKDAKKAPKMADLMGMSDEEFKFNREYLDGIFNGTIDPSQG
ncbi:MAG: hypothetical protein J6O99_05885 [Methanobrevibacter sp.]|nr:hypothetical protein [Methanobrevibacter sp.]MBO6105407.1 hypothetical protein [Methanobrevibacter sp.]MBO7240884.1 hypothetical protein [Methanobrevibacter sp.]MBO7518059.1 hypothetical protein [Methanobrevibacter sp.]MBP5699955.1 hypothetical protein [Methanobrevibacter sp.]